MNYCHDDIVGGNPRYYDQAKGSRRLSQLLGTDWRNSPMLLISPFLTRVWYDEENIHGDLNKVM